MKTPNQAMQPRAQTALFFMPNVASATESIRLRSPEPWLSLLSFGPYPGAETATPV